MLNDAQYSAYITRNPELPTVVEHFWAFWWPWYQSVMPYDHFMEV